MPKPSRDLIETVLGEVHPDEPRRVSHIAERVSDVWGEVSVDTVGACLRVLRDEGQVRKIRAANGEPARSSKHHDPLGGYVLAGKALRRWRKLNPPKKRSARPRSRRAS